MAETDNKRDIDSLGMMQKAATLDAHSVTEEDLRAINKLAPVPLTAEEVFTFKAVLCDNELDRHFDQFTLKALQDMQKLFLGKTVIKDHRRSTDNQVARIYKTELVQSTKAAKSGELYTQLVAHCYMVRTASNADLIAEIKGGIKKEGGVGFAPASSICSICGTDNTKTYCPHWPGKSYAKGEGNQVCTFTLAGVKDAYEFSLVAVPAQRAAGVSKSYTGETVYEKEEPETPPETGNPDDQAEKVKELQLRARMGLTTARTNNNHL